MFAYAIAYVLAREIVIVSHVRKNNNLKFNLETVLLRIQ